MTDKEKKRMAEKSVGNTALGAAICLELLTDVSNAYYQETYLRPLHRALVVSEAERIAKAKVTR